MYSMDIIVDNILKMVNVILCKSHISGKKSKTQKRYLSLREPMTPESE